MNPLNMDKMREMVELLRLERGGHVLDVACGKTDFLCMVADRYGVRGTGVDASPFTSAELLEKVHRQRDAYLRSGRDCLGWALYLFRKPHLCRLTI